MRPVTAEHLNVLFNNLLTRKTTSKVGFFRNFLTRKITYKGGFEEADWQVTVISHEKKEHDGHHSLESTLMVLNKSNGWFGFAKIEIMSDGKVELTRRKIRQENK